MEHKKGKREKGSERWNIKKERVKNGVRDGT